MIASIKEQSHERDTACPNIRVLARVVSRKEGFDVYEAAVYPPSLTVATAAAGSVGGRLAAFLVYWIDPISKSGLFQPVGSIRISGVVA